MTAMIEKTTFDLALDFVLKWEGGYVNNKRNGFGTYTFADGTVQSGKWIEDEFIG